VERYSADQGPIKGPIKGGGLMAATPTTKAQVQAYRFVLRRMEHALVRKDAIMLHDPMRTQVRATAVGLVIGVLGLAGFALTSVFAPPTTSARTRSWSASGHCRCSWCGRRAAPGCCTRC